MRYTSGMRVLASAALVALVLVPGATAKMRLQLGLSPSQPQVGAVVEVRLTTERSVPAATWMRLAVVAPGAALMDVVAAVAGQRPAYPLTLQDSFGVRLTRSGNRSWRAEIRFPRPGTWRVVLPNVGPGYTMPPLLIRPVRVG